MAPAGGLLPLAWTCACASCDAAQTCYKTAPNPVSDPCLERRQRPDPRLLQESAALYKWCADYILRNDVKASMYLEEPARDMAHLVDDKAKWLAMTNKVSGA